MTTTTATDSNGRTITVGTRVTVGMWKRNHVTGVVESISDYFVSVKRDGYRQTITIVRSQLAEHDLHILETERTPVVATVAFVASEDDTTEEFTTMAAALTDITGSARELGYTVKFRTVTAAIIAGDYLEGEEFAAAFTIADLDRALVDLETQAQLTRLNALPKL